MPLAPSDDVKIYYERHGDGDGPPVVFIRGTGGDGTRWMPQIEAYKAHVPCVIFDGRGVGKSDTTPPPYTVAQMAADTIAVLDHLGLESVHISGSSLGGAIGLHIAAHRPERVRTLQMHSSWLATRGYVEFSLGLLKKILQAGGTEFYYEATLPLLFSPRFMTDNFEDLMRILAHMKAHPATEDGLLGQIEANLGHDLSAEVGARRRPDADHRG